MRDLETWLAETREDLPPGCNLRVLLCGGSGNVFFEITDTFGGPPFVWASGTDITDAMLVIAERVRRLREAMGIK